VSQSKKKPTRKPSPFIAAGRCIAKCRESEINGRRLVVISTPLWCLNAKTMKRFASWCDRAAAWCTEERRKGGVRAQE
jgi:hypothetical protein